MEKVRDKMSSLTDDFEQESFYNREEFINECSREIGEREAIKKVAKNMFKETSDIDFIIRVTGLTKEEINSLKEKDEK